MATTTTTTVTEEIQLSQLDAQRTPSEPEEVAFEAGEDPRTWSPARKWASVSLVSMYSVASTVASSMVAPALSDISTDLKVTSSVTRNMILSIFLLAYAVGPLVLGPLGEAYGRSKILHSTIMFFLVFNLACSASRSSGQLLTFRFLSGIGASGSTSVGGASCVDLFPPQSRGKALALYAFFPLLGPAIGPIIGGLLIQVTQEWKWIFWSSSVYASLVFLVGLALLRETYAPVLLAKKCRKLRKQGRNVVSPFEEREEQGPQRPAWTRKVQDLAQSTSRPVRFLLTQPIISLLAFEMYTVYGAMYHLLTIVPTTFENIYGQSPGIASLNYISVALGFTFGCQVGGTAVDRLHATLSARKGNSCPEFKLPVLLTSAILIPLGMALFGLAVEKRVHWIVPNICAFILATGTIGSYISIQAYLVDLMPLYSSSCIAAVVFMRSLGGFTFPLFAAPLYDSLGYAKASAILAAILAALALPIPVVLWFFGPTLRKKPERFLDRQKGGRFLR